MTDGRSHQRESALAVLANVLSQVAPHVRLEIDDMVEGFNDVFHATLIKGEGQAAAKRIREVGPSFGRSNAIEGVVTIEAVQRATADPSWAAEVFFELVAILRSKGGSKIFWQLTTEGLRRLDPGDRIVGPQFFDQLADEAAIVEGRKGFRRWLHGARLSVD